jgi:cytidylate kinase
MATITISRQFGAGGITLGELIAEKLSYKLYDRRILQLIAKETKVTTRWVEYFDKQIGSKFQRVISSFSEKGRIESISNTANGLINQKIYLNNLHKIITSIAVKDNAVIVGRGGQYILKDCENVAHILLISNESDRIKYLTEKYEISYEQAAKTVKDEDVRRLNLYRIFNKSDYDKPFNYHLVINMSKVTKQKACDVVCGLAGYLT